MCLTSVALASKDTYYLLIDAQGSAIEALADKKNNNNVSEIKVGECYLVTGHVCTTQRASGRVVDHPASLVIVPRTVFKHIKDKDITTFYFDFVPFSAFEVRRLHKNALLTDYLGRVQSSTGVIRRQGKTLLKLVLLEPSGEDVSLTLWEGIALSFTTDNVVGKMLDVGSAKVTNYLGRLQLESTDITVTYIDRRWKNYLRSWPGLRPRPANLTRLQQMAASANMGCLLADLRLKEPKEYKNKLYKCTATMKHFEDHRGWYLTQCSHSGCHENLYEEVSDDDEESEFTKAPTLICRAGHPVEEPNYEYSVNGILMDDSAILPVVIFNEAMAAALEMSCKELVIDHGFSNAKKIPKHMLSLIGISCEYTLRMKNSDLAAVECITKLNTGCEAKRIESMATPVKGNTETAAMAPIASPIKPLTPAGKASRKITAIQSGDDISSSKKLKDAGEAFVCINAPPFDRVAPHDAAIEIDKRLMPVPSKKNLKIPWKYFNFATPNQLLNRPFPDTQLIDYMGKVTSLEQAYTLEDNSILRMSLQEPGSVPVMVILWEAIYEKLLLWCITDVNREAIVAATALRVLYEGGRLILHCTTGTRVLIDPGIPRRRKMARRFKAERGSAPFKKVSKRVVSEVYPIPGLPISDSAHLYQQRPHTLQNERYLIACTIIRIPEPQPWYYVACDACHRTLKRENQDWACPYHGQMYLTYRYEVRCTVEDISGKMELKLHDSIIIAMVGVRCFDMIAIYGFADINILPNIIRGLLCGRWIMTVANGQIQDNKMLQFEVSEVSPWHDAAVSPKPMPKETNAMSLDMGETSHQAAAGGIEDV
ncbi:hypothetical protein SSX86_031549 [Deinandra increscens subsp. villosa]|uniref:Replication factor A C-terminal domain-containing protein n=1 Tax=Deinandra increscens subsp. villosa TaxID=3103831 RepID=A0AAP0GI40_9ASTR